MSVFSKTNCLAGSFAGLLSRYLLGVSLLAVWWTYGRVFGTRATTKISADVAESRANRRGNGGPKAVDSVESPQGRRFDLNRGTFKP